MAGVQIGSVTGVKGDFQKGQVVISWKINRGVKLGTQTSAEVVLATLLGGQYIRLSGPIDKPYLSSLPASQRRIPLDRTRVPSTVGQVLTSATHLIQQLDTKSINELLAQFSQISTDTKDNFGQLLANLATVSAAINQRDQQLRQLIANTQQITATLAAKDQVLPQLIDSATVLLNTITARRNELATLLGTGSQAVQTMSNLITDHRAQLDALLGDIHAILTGALTPQLHQIDAGMAWAGPAFHGAVTSGEQGPWIDLVIYGFSVVQFTDIVKAIQPGGKA